MTATVIRELTDQEREERVDREISEAIARHNNGAPKELTLFNKANLIAENKQLAEEAEKLWKNSNKSPEAYREITERIYNTYLA